jgi:transcriptional regulator with XRE-family HTH domain
MRELVEAELNRGIKQRPLAERIGISQGTVQKILYSETTNFSYDVRKKVADYFKVDVSTFYSDASPLPHTADRPPGGRANGDEMAVVLLALQTLNSRLDDQRDQMESIKKLITRYKDENSKQWDVIKDELAATNTRIDDIDQQLNAAAQKKDFSCLGIKRRSA